MKRLIAIISILLLGAVMLYATPPAEARCASPQTCIQADIQAAFTLQDVLTLDYMPVEWQPAATEAVQIQACDDQGVKKLQTEVQYGTLPQRYRQLQMQETTDNGRAPYYQGRHGHRHYRSPASPPDATRVRKK